MKFCENCNNMLYPQERSSQHGEGKTLVYACRMCPHQEEATAGHEGYRIYKKDFHKTDSEFSTVVLHVASDPTLPRTRLTSCPRCGYKEAVFFQARDAGNAGRMALYFVCVSCQARWMDVDTAAAES